eukprot:3170823-Rhodomonas_salina.1
MLPGGTIDEVAGPDASSTLAEASSVYVCWDVQSKDECHGPYYTDGTAAAKNYLICIESYLEGEEAMAPATPVQRVRVWPSEDGMETERAEELSTEEAADRPDGQPAGRCDGGKEGAEATESDDTCEGGGEETESEGAGGSGEEAAGRGEREKNGALLVTEADMEVDEEEEAQGQ